MHTPRPCTCTHRVRAHAHARACTCTCTPSPSQRCLRLLATLPPPARHPASACSPPCLRMLATLPPHARHDLDTISAYSLRDGLHGLGNLPPQKLRRHRALDLEGECMQCLEILEPLGLSLRVEVAVSSQLMRTLAPPFLHLAGGLSNLELSTSSVHASGS